MQKNTLFNFILQEQEAGATAQNPEKITLKQDQLGSSYFLIELPWTDKLVKTSEHSSSLSLREHHISIYERMNEASAQLNQYHYTAIFADESEIRYRLHVYFDSSDRVVGKPELCVEKDSSWEKISLPGLENQFAELAKERCLPVISVARDKLKDRVAELDRLYTEQEMAAAKLHSQLAKRSEYGEALAVVERTLKDLIPLDRSNKYQGILKIINKIQVTVAEELSKATTSNLPSSSVVESTEAAPTAAMPEAVDSNVSETSTVSKAKKKRHKSKGMAAELNRQVDQLNSAYKRLATAGPKITARDIEDLLKCYDECTLIILSLEGKSGLNISVLNNLKTLEEKIRKLGEERLKTLLLTDRFAEAQKLKPFHLTIDKEPLIIEGLTRNNGRLLAFLIEFCGLELGHSLIIGGQKYSSMIEYISSVNNVDLLLSVMEPCLVKFSAENIEQWPQEIKKMDELMAGHQPEISDPYQFGRELGRQLVKECPEIIDMVGQAMGLPPPNSHAHNRHRFHRPRPNGKASNLGTNNDLETCLLM
ncbi:hypothetical protein B6N58_13865 [Legionella micdadei]|uniref:hypothetical protein n=1 Tax=Legionella micdadei TaxID=451 RepID=UPI0009EF72CA|nr:hypothetical protein [Legionella micdadei]ARG98655.1 hypothetical protein B6N58_13865 [Legionella micdadei]